ncbi:iron complex outermembrane recepter protein [Pseudomonas flavescens]|uniref:Iron complex outermembrane recepter protein n=1 Tax=Phytopseudomonas flavescens TaxID=29435 RepID=A0A1G8KE36_9GAMM|nr:TonB-dependent receptor [Pseudomonas flavescens]SDI41668.1 iron complex outermembrane recepter protein [Pseudomonas flavescens]
MHAPGFVRPEKRLPYALSLLCLALPGAAWAAEKDTALGTVSVISTGNRSNTLTVADSPSPIDIISGEQIRKTGKASLREALGRIVPSFSAPAQAGGGTSSSVRPVSIRGLSGDHLLVLVNGKRRHNTAVYNNFARIASGSVPVDLDLVPTSAIERIELLRDGASAQYGSDAIAGVLNIILKSQDNGGSASVTSGQQEDKPGDLTQTGLNGGFALGDNGGFFNSSLDIRLQGPSYAAGDAQGAWYYPVQGGQSVPFGTPGAQPDPREGSVDRLLEKGYGRSNRDKVYNLSYNAELPLRDDLTLYSFATYSDREIVDTRGSFRATSLASIPEIYPDGFHAQRLIDERDFQVAFGGKGDLAGWAYDLSTTYGKDDVRLGAQNTLNASLGPASKTSFYLGALEFEQWTSNLDITRPFDIGLPKPLQLSAGIEHRWEKYLQTEGEPDSYRDGGYVYPVGHPRAGQRPSAGLQSFTGTSVADAGSLDRDSYAVYLDAGSNLTERWYTSAAVRFEHYDDSSGNTASGKLSTRYELAPGLALRGTFNTGFRAPSLAQKTFSVTQNTAVRLPDGSYQLLLARYLPPGSTAAQALGGQDLEPEKSTNFSVGISWEPTRNARITLDAYRIEIKDRIVKSEIIRDSGSSTVIRDTLASLGINDLYSAQYNMNGVDTRTDGVDLVSELNSDYGRFGQVRWSALYSYNHTTLRDIKQNGTVSNLLGSDYVIFGHQAQTDLTRGTPRDKLVFGSNWRIGDFITDVQLTRYGTYTEAGISAAADREFGARWITDLDLTYLVNDNLSASIGANNLFGIRPDKQTANPSVTGLGAANPSEINNPDEYGSFSPYGLNGAFYYARLSYDW